MESPRIMGMHGENSSKTRKQGSSLVATLDHLSKWMAAAVVGGVMAWRGDGGGMWAALGALLNWGLSVWLKNLIAQPRPFPAKKSDHGMPSSHSQSLFYGFAFLTLSVAEFTGMNHVVYAVGGFSIYFSSYLSLLRVTQQYHTRNQVVVGALLGTLFCNLWQYAWSLLVSHVFGSSLWIRVVVVLGAATFWMVLFKITISTFSRTRKTNVTNTTKTLAPLCKQN